jgi:hypothetical protein
MKSRLYYIKVETLANYMKDYMFACFQKQKEYEIEIEKKDKQKWLTLYNQQTLRHVWFKFKQTKTGFYVIVYKPNNFKHDRV